MTEEAPKKQRNNWAELLPLIQADRASGMTMEAIANKHNVNIGSVSTYLNKGKPKADKPKAQETIDGTGKTIGEGVNAKGLSALSELTDSDIKAAKTLLSKALKGKVDLSSQQVALIKFVLGDDDSDEEEVNPYAGVDEEELAERMLVTAVSVLGLQSVTVRLRNMLKSEPALLDLLGDEDAIPEEAQPIALEQSEGKASERLLYDTSDSDEDHTETETPKPETSQPIPAPTPKPSAGVIVESIGELE